MKSLKKILQKNSQKVVRILNVKNLDTKQILSNEKKNKPIRT